MIVSGVYLAQTDLTGMLKNKKNYIVSACRLLVIPVLTALAFRFFPMKEEILTAVLIAAAAPVGSNAAVFAQQRNKDYKQAVEYVCMSTILCLITLPLIILLI